MLESRMGWVMHEASLPSPAKAPQRPHSSPHVIEKATQKQIGCAAMHLIGKPDVDTGVLRQETLSAN